MKPEEEFINELKIRGNVFEKEFFKTFEIEPVFYRLCSKPRLDCTARETDLCTDGCEYYSGTLYPQITAEILLELICILMNGSSNISIQNYDKPININGFKNLILTACIDCAECIKDKVKSLFEEEGEE